MSSGETDRGRSGAAEGAELLRPVPKSSVSDAIVDQITDLISRNVLKPGDRLPSERELCRRFAVGRTSVREALRSLSVMGILTGRVGDGTFVADNESHLGRAYEWGLRPRPEAGRRPHRDAAHAGVQHGLVGRRARQRTEPRGDRGDAARNGEGDRAAGRVPRVRRRLPPRGRPRRPQLDPLQPGAHHPRLPAGVDQGEPGNLVIPGGGPRQAFRVPASRGFRCPRSGRTPGPRARACAPTSCRAARTFSPISVEAPGPEPPCGLAAKTRRRSPDRSRSPGGRRR